MQQTASEVALARAAREGRLDNAVLVRPEEEGIGAPQAKIILPLGSKAGRPGVALHACHFRRFDFRICFAAPFFVRGYVIVLIVRYRSRAMT